jgi:hypothetical protein
MRMGLCLPRDAWAQQAWLALMPGLQGELLMLRQVLIGLFGGAAIVAVLLALKPSQESGAASQGPGEKKASSGQSNPGDSQPRRAPCVNCDFVSP